ncbi:P-loop NTPase [candidate division WOR-3 bacterium]|nr:P-loop NTPase [candidate division WOR-3 bacterium]
MVMPGRSSSMASIAFFSVKGGTGRSLALANVAALLASRGRAVGCVDFDLLAPGLATIFGVPAGVTQKRPSTAELLLRDCNIMSFSRAIIDCGKYVDLPPKRLYLIAAKPESKDTYKELADPGQFDEINIDTFKSRYLTPFEQLRQLDYTFVDARSGIAQESFTALSLADRRIVLFSRLDPQSLTGTLHFLRLAKRDFKCDFDCIVVATGVPAGDSPILVGGRKYMVDDQVVEILDGYNRELLKYGASVGCVVLFDPRMLLEHLLPAVHDSGSATAAGYCHLADIIQDIR